MRIATCRCGSLKAEYVPKSLRACLCAIAANAKGEPAARFRRRRDFRCGASL
jgi:hypothetical protein